MSRRIYLDYASLTPTDPRVLREMKRSSAPAYANPSSIYMEGVAAKNALADARARVGAFLHAHADEIVFTSGGTEANGLALEGAGRAAHRKGMAKPHLVISAVEHSSVMETAAMMEKHGVEVTRLPVDGDGVVSAEEVKKAVRPETFMVSIMTVNNETGAVQPIREIAKAIRQARKALGRPAADPLSAYPLFHTDAAQAAIYADLNIEQLGVDMLTLDGAKIYGPRGIGALCVRRGAPIEQIIYGGGQERGLRSGTENIPAIMGLAKALDLAAAEREREQKRIAGLKDAFWDGLKRIFPSATANTPLDRAMPHILNVSIPDIDNEYFVLRLDAAGIACSTKSSCLRDEDQSYVLQAMGADSRTAVRFSFGRLTKMTDIRRTLAVLAKMAHI